MPITPKIQALVDRLNQELDRTEQTATQGLNIVRQVLSLFPDNAIMIQYFAGLNNFLFFVEVSRSRIQTLVETISPDDAPAEVIQEAGEDLGTQLGRVLEAKRGVERILNRLEKLQ